MKRAGEYGEENSESQSLKKQKTNAQSPGQINNDLMVVALNSLNQIDPSHLEEGRPSFLKMTTLLFPEFSERN